MIKILDQLKELVLIIQRIQLRDSSKNGISINSAITCETLCTSFPKCKKISKASYGKMVKLADRMLHIL